MSYTSDAYNNSLSELKSIERAIQADLKELKINAGNSVNTFNTENSCRKNLSNYQNKITKIKEDYEKNQKNIKFSIPEKEYNRRVNEIIALTNSYNEMQSTYDSKGTTSNDLKLQPHEEDENMKNMSNKQIYDYSQKKLKDQDAQIDEMIGYTKKGKELGNELKNELTKQNLLLDDVEKDIDKVTGKMVKTRGKFNQYIESSSNCCLLIVIIVELIALVCILVLWP